MKRFRRRRPLRDLKCRTNYTSKKLGLVDFILHLYHDNRQKRRCNYMDLLIYLSVSGASIAWHARTKRTNRGCRTRSLRRRIPSLEVDYCYVKEQSN